jgi:hypothetical protein
MMIVLVQVMMWCDHDNDNDSTDDNDDTQNTGDEVAAKLNVDLSKPLRKGEDALPTIKAYERKSR